MLPKLLLKPKLTNPTKLTTLLQTINLSLSAPDLSASTLQYSKAYIFLVPHETKARRERIAGCVIAQRISTAMAVVPSRSSATRQDSDSEKASTTVIVDTDTNLCCSPEPLSTPMGISRLFVSSSHRRLGIAQSLLDAASATFIHGCPLDPTTGQVAFSQPTGMGQAIMKSWGKGGVRVYEE
jgi:N-acetyltransferase